MDLRPVEQYNRSLSGIERRLVGDLMRDYRAWRVVLLDLLDRLGLSPEFAARVEMGGRELTATAKDIARKYQPEISAAAHKYAEKQLEQAKRAGVPVPAITPAAQELAIAADLAAALSAYVDVVQGRIKLDASRLRLAGDDADPAGQLLAVRLVDRRASAWRHGRNTLVSNAILGIWGAGNGIGGDVFAQAQAQTGESYQRQAIAAIDERTTDCCLRVHGQIVGFGQDFRLTGTPRFASSMYGPPFHWNCRTAVTMYRPEMETIGVTTDEMTGAAKAEIYARQRTKRRAVIHPAHATSRRTIEQ